MEKEGLFQPTDFWYFREILKVIFLFALAGYIMITSEHTYLNLLIAAFVHGHAN